MPTHRSTNRRSLTPEELGACRNDPAWEARQGMVDLVICRVCGARLQTRVAGRHLRRHQMSISEYRAAYPAARLYSFRCSAERHGDDAQKLMANFLARYVTPEELAECRGNARWEKDNQVTFVVCRLCGEKLSTDLSPHLKGKKHGMNPTNYIALYPRARLTSLAHYARTRARVNKNLEQEHAYQRTYRKAHPEKINAIQRRCYANRPPEKVEKDTKRGQVAYARKLAKKADAERQAKILEAMKKMPESGVRIVLYLAKHQHADNAEVRAATRTSLSTDRMRILRGIAGVPGPRGRPSKKL